MATYGWSPALQYRYHKMYKGCSGKAPSDSQSYRGQQKSVEIQQILA